MAEDTGLIGPLTEWVVRHVLLEQEPLLRRFPELRLSINCPTSLLASGGLEQILRRINVAPHLASNLVFEITEHVFVGHRVDSVREAMSRLRRAGFRFALDDFGTGYSSFGHLGKLEFEFLKIDRSFVQAIGASDATTSIFDTLVDLADTLGMVTVAEGVETDQQRCHLEQRGVPFAQGWLFATPLPISDSRSCCQTGTAQILDDPIVEHMPPQVTERLPTALGRDSGLSTGSPAAIFAWVP